jgi:hypothetical protein
MTESKLPGLEMSQSAPFPTALDNLVSSCTYRPGWAIRLGHEDRGQDSVGLTLTITTWTVNSYNHDEPMAVQHLFIVPAAAYDERSWQRWLFECFHQVEFHEAMEFFEIAGEKPYAPSHGPGNDPYLLREVGTDLDRRTSFRGEVKPEPPARCSMFRRERTPEDHDYDPISQVVRTPPEPMGWYSADDGEVCGKCMTDLLGRANS